MKRKTIIKKLGIITLVLLTSALTACGKSKSANDSNSHEAIETIGAQDLITAPASDSNSESDKNSKSAENISDKLSETISEVPLAVTPEPITPESEAAEITFTISAAGDCTLGTDENFDYDTSFNAMVDDVGYYEYFFENVQDEFASDDLTIVNLEGTFTYGDYREDKTYAFKGDPSYVNILTAGSIEACNFANNHAYDYGSESYEDTINYVEDAGITIFGNDRSKVIDVKGVKVGLVGIYELAKDIDCMEDLLRELDVVKEADAQVIITSFHWGDEGEHYPTETQIELAHCAIDNGADLVLGHHPHVLQGVETYNGKNIVYSMGNFCFGGNKNPSDKNSMVFKQTFTVKNGELQEGNDYSIIPCRLSSSTEYNDYRPTILYGDEGQEVLDLISAYSEGIYE